MIWKKQLKTLMINRLNDNDKYRLNIKQCILLIVVLKKLQKVKTKNR